MKFLLEIDSDTQTWKTVRATPSAMSDSVRWIIDAFTEESAKSHMTDFDRALAIKILDGVLRAKVSPM